MESWPFGIEFLEYSVLDSTNAEGKRIAFKNDAKTWIFAHRQTAGRGSRGRLWFSDKDNFTASYLFYPSGSLKELAQRTFTTSLALFDSLVHAGVNPDQLTLKWPNDVLLNKKKISGILLETKANPNSSGLALIIGIGINLFSCPNLMEGQERDGTTTTVKCVLDSKTPTALKMLTYLANSLQYWENIYRDKGFSFVKKAWLALSHPLGSQVKVSVNGEERIGVFFGISNDGSFLLKSNGDLCTISIGDIFFIDV